MTTKTTTPILTIKHLALCAAILAIVAIEWMLSAWADRATGDHEVNEQLRRELFGPIELPVVALAGVTAFVEQEFRHNKQRDPANTFGRIGQTRKHEMDNVIRHLMFTVGDVNLLTKNAVRVAIGLRAGFDRGEI